MADLTDSEVWAMMTVEQLEKAYPGVLTAYEFVVPSYGWMLTRFEAADNRLQTILTFALTITVVGLGAVRALKPIISFHDWRFIGAVLLFVVLTVVGLIYRVSGGIQLANPSVFFERWTRLEEWEFKKTALEFSGKHFRANLERVRGKATASAWMLGLLAAEVALLVRVVCDRLGRRFLTGRRRLLRLGSGVQFGRAMVAQLRRDTRWLRSSRAWP